MNNNEEKKKRKIHLIPESVPMTIAMIGTLILEIMAFVMVIVINVLPVKYMAALVIVVIAADVCSFGLMCSRRKNSSRQVIGLILSILIMMCSAAGFYYLLNTYDTLSKISMDRHAHEKYGDVEKPFNMYISGIDSRQDISDNAARSDVNMIVTVNPQTETILLTSIPRDAYVPLHMNGEMDKLTHTGVYGIDETVATVEDWLGIEIDYYARVDFHMLVNLVDAVGGIRVYNNIDFMSHPKGWHYKKGWLDLNGKRALWFARERKSFEDEDEQRIRNQQKVVDALIKKITQSTTLMASYTKLLDAVEANMQTSMSQTQMTQLAKMQLEYMPEWTVKKQWIDGDDAERGTWSMGPNRPLFVSIPKEESVKKAVANINRVLGKTGKSGKTEKTEEQTQ